VRRVEKFATYMCRLSRSSETLNLLQSGGPVQASIGNSFPLPKTQRPLKTKTVYFVEKVRFNNPVTQQNNQKYFNAHGSVLRKNILIYIQQDAMLHSLIYLKTALHVRGGTSTHHQERIQLYLQHLVFVTTILLPATIVEKIQLFLYLQHLEFVTTLLLPATIVEKIQIFRYLQHLVIVTPLLLPTTIVENIQLLLYLQHLKFVTTLLLPANIVEKIQIFRYLQHLVFVTPLLLPATIVENIQLLLYLQRLEFVTSLLLPATIVEEIHFFLYL
jgi:hypothetical protein